MPTSDVYVLCSDMVSADTVICSSDMVCANNDM